MVNLAHEPSAGNNQHVGDVLAELMNESGQPRLTWYDTAERIELSGAVVVNWVNKTTNLLVEEFDAAPGVTIVMDLPGHWRSVIWAVSAWRAGATVAFSDSPTMLSGLEEPAVVVTDRPGDWFSGELELIAVELSALARVFAGELPPGAVDAATAVMTYGDQLGWMPPLDDSAAAIRHPDSLDDVSHGDLLPLAIREATGNSASGTRALLEATSAEMAALSALGQWVTGGSVVFVAPAAATELRGDRARLDTIANQERAVIGSGFDEAGTSE